VTGTAWLPAWSIMVAVVWGQQYAEVGTVT
jgi:hypothetical protein